MGTLTDKEKETIKNKYNKYIDTLSKALNINKTEVKTLIHKNSTHDSLSDIYTDYSNKKDKFKGGVPGGFDRYFSKEMENAEKIIKKDKRQAQEGNYNTKTEEFIRKGPRGNKRKDLSKYSNSVRIIE